MNPTEFRFTNARPENTPEEIAEQLKMCPGTPSFLMNTMVDINRCIASPEYSALRQLERKIGYLNGKASYSFDVLHTTTYKKKRIELFHNAAGEVQGYIIKKTRKVVHLTDSEKEKLSPHWNYF